MVRDPTRLTDPETGRPSSGDGLTVIGFTHQTCPASIRERLYMEDDEAGPVEAAIRDAGCEAAMVLSTCDRVDLVVQAGDEGAVSVERVTERLTAAAGFEAGLVLPYRHVMAGPDAFRYLARVAAGMESQIIGEAQVLGQLKAAHRRAEAAGHVTGRLSGALQAAYRAAKRVRSETAIGEESVSLASTAVDLVHQLHGDLTGLSGVLVGAGDMGLFLVDALTRAGLSRWTVVGRSDRRARALAHQVGAADRAILDDLAAVLDRGDVVVTALGDGPETLSAERVEGVLRRRRRRPMFFLDVGVPGDVEAAVHRLDDAFVYSLDDLSALAEEGLQKRRASLEAADRIIAEETMRFETERAERSAVPAIQALTRKLDALKKEAAGDDPAPEVAAALDRFASRLLHHPATALRMAAAQGDGLALEGAVRKLFKLDESESRNEDKNEES